MLPHVSVVALVADSKEVCARPEHSARKRELSVAEITREDCAAAVAHLICSGIMTQQQQSLPALWPHKT